MSTEYRLRLVNTSRWKKKGLVRVASSSNGVLDIAAQVELGLIADVGIVSLLSPAIRARARRLLKTNFLYPIKAKEATLRGDHKKAQVLALVRQALPDVIGPLYWVVKRKACYRTEKALSRKAFVSWVKAEIEDGQSELNKRLHRAGYFDICGLERDTQWWERHL